MVAKTFMSLERLKNYRAYLVGIQKTEINSTYGKIKTQEVEAKLKWYEEEIESVDEWIETRLQEQTRREQDKAARAWLFPKKRPWWKRMFDKKAKPLLIDTPPYISHDEYREALGLPPYSGNEADIARFETARLGEWIPETDEPKLHIHIAPGVDIQKTANDVLKRRGRADWYQDTASDYPDYVRTDPPYDR